VRGSREVLDRVPIPSQLSLSAVGLCRGGLSPGTLVSWSRWWWFTPWSGPGVVLAWFCQAFPRVSLLFPDRLAVTLVWALSAFGRRVGLFSVWLVARLSSALVTVACVFRRGVSCAVHLTRLLGSSRRSFVSELSSPRHRCFTVPGRPLALCGLCVVFLSPLVTLALLFVILCHFFLLYIGRPLR